GLTHFFYQELTDAVHFVVEDGILIITSRISQYKILYGIKKVYPDNTSKVLLRNEFYFIYRCIPKDNQFFNMLFAVQQGDNKGLYDYHTNTIHWGVTTRKLRAYKQGFTMVDTRRIVKSRLFPSYLEFPLNITASETNVRILQPLTDLEKIAFGYLPVCFVGDKHRRKIAV
ncbi:MAG: hypothetical protein LBU62_03985, partial [Bacteroidales bacterium]|nr:hypothetical protein [Bacteroidales bacterium]